MKTFNDYLNKTGEVGFVDTVLGPIIYAHGLPHVHPKEMVLFETGEMGYVMSFNENQVEIALLSPTDVAVGTRIARTDGGLKIKVDDSMLGRVITSSDIEKSIFNLDDDTSDAYDIDNTKTSFSERTKLTHPLEVKVTMVDMLIPLAKGQREIIVGDRKTGKSAFLHQVVLAAAEQGITCIYATIGKTEQEIQRVATFFKSHEVSKHVILIAANSAHRPAVTFLTPYIAMTIAEHFRDQGKDVLLVLDDLTTHARYYRELMLLAKRFPGRGSYPGDIFYIHSRLLERAGSFTKGTITCLPVAQSVQGDLSGYIQTNLMSITDGHIYFDNEYFDQGRRPAINPFLSVTRVGAQTQTDLQREIGRQLRGFLSHFEKIKQFKHFQSELSESIQSNFDLGERLQIFLDQSLDVLVPSSINIIIFGAVWINFWKNIPIVKMKQDFASIRTAYQEEPEFKKLVDLILTSSPNLTEFLQQLKINQMAIMERTRVSTAVAVTPTPIQTEIALQTPPVADEAGNI